jgi:hypothetical protein
MCVRSFGRGCRWSGRQICGSRSIKRRPTRVPMSARRRRRRWTPTAWTVISLTSTVVSTSHGPLIAHPGQRFRYLLVDRHRGRRPFERDALVFEQLRGEPRAAGELAAMDSVIQRAAVVQGHHAAAERLRRGRRSWDGRAACTPRSDPAGRARSPACRFRGGPGRGRVLDLLHARAQIAGAQECPAVAGRSPVVVRSRARLLAPPNRSIMPSTASAGSRPVPPALRRTPPKRHRRPTYARAAR